MLVPEATIKNGEADPTERNNALLMALWRLLVPVARLCLAQGETYAAADDLLKKAFVQEAAALQPGAPGHGMVSRVSTATGINRREVTRLTKLGAQKRQVKQPLVSELFARWTTGSGWRDSSGTPLVLKRQGGEPSFEALAQEITRDVHPRSLLDEMLRLGIARHDEEQDMVSLNGDSFVPANDSRHMLNFLSDNVGDHLEGAVSNLLHNGTGHLEQAVFADGLSPESIEALRPVVMEQWHALRNALVPQLTKHIEADTAAQLPQTQRIRIGLYSFTEPVSSGEPAVGKAVARKKSRSSAKEPPK